MPDPLELAPGKPRGPLHQRQQLPTPITPGKGVNLIDDQDPEVAQQTAGVDPAGNQHHRERLEGSQQAIGRLAQNPAPCCLFHVAMS